MINLIYVASIGRSGSTLLESMLGAHPQIATTGEAHIWPHEIRMGGVQPCGCGASVPDCTFWNAVQSQCDPLRQEGPSLDYFREAHNHGHTLRPTRLRAFGNTPTDALPERDLIRQYGGNNAAFFDAFASVTEAETGTRPEWIVDASKDPYRLAWLARSGRFRIKVVHLVKDPRAFVYSVTKRYIHGEDGRPPSSPLVRLFFSARQAGAWTAQNELFARLSGTVLPYEDSLLVQYEALASDPYGTFEQVCEHIGISYEPAAVESFRSGSIHTIAGNPMRYERRGIRLDERWKTNLPPSSRSVATSVAKWTQGQYGYGPGGRAPRGRAVLRGRLAELANLGRA